MKNKNKYIEIFIKSFSIDKKKFNEKIKYNDIPEWDSFKHIELIIAIEEKFKIQLEYTDTTEMVSIPIIKSKILKLMNNE